MIMKVAFVQPIYDHYRKDTQTPKDGLHKKKSSSFASVLGNLMKAQSTRA